MKPSESIMEKLAYVRGWVSDCCGGFLTVGGYDPGWYNCFTCGKPCSPRRADGRTSEEKGCRV